MRDSIKNYQLRIKNWSIFIWLLFIPTQLGLHFWPEWSHVLGLRVDYLSPTLYFLDLVWIGMILKLRVVSYELRVKEILNIKNILLFSFVLINIFVAGNKWEAGYRWLRIWQWILTVKIIIDNKKLFREMLMKVLPFWIVGEGLLAVAQVINGGSLNGIMWWFGERRFSYTTIGVAQISFLGEGLIRAYGTFSHPNSLAGFMLISLVLFLKNKRHNIFYWVVVFCGLLGIVLSGSRTVWLILIGLVISYQLRVASWKVRWGTLFIVGGIVALIFSLISNNYRIADFVGGWDSEGMAKRGALMVASLKMIKDHPLFGVGAGNFLVQLPEYQKNSGVFWLQPVHNIIFLLVTEYGLVGLALLFLYIKKIKYKNNLIVLGIILITGMVDHYWLTLPQNSWLMAIVLGLM